MEITTNHSVHIIHVQTISVSNIIQRKLFDRKQTLEKNPPTLIRSLSSYLPTTRCRFFPPDYVSVHPVGKAETLCHMIYVTYSVSKHSQQIESDSPYTYAHIYAVMSPSLSVCLFLFLSLYLSISFSPSLSYIYINTYIYIYWCSQIEFICYEWCLLDEYVIDTLIVTVSS